MASRSLCLSMGFRIFDPVQVREKSCSNRSAARERETLGNVIPSPAGWVMMHMSRTTRAVIPQLFHSLQ